MLPYRPAPPKAVMTRGVAVVSAVWVAACAAVSKADVSYEERPSGRRQDTTPVWISPQETSVVVAEAVGADSARTEARHTPAPKALTALSDLSMKVLSGMFGRAGRAITARIARRRPA